MKLEIVRPPAGAESERIDHLRAVIRAAIFPDPHGQRLSRFHKDLSFKVVSACSGVFDLTLRVQEKSPFGESKTSMGYGTVRFQKVYIPRR